MFLVAVILVVREMFLVAMVLVAMVLVAMLYGSENVSGSHSAGSHGSDYGSGIHDSDSPGSGSHCVARINFGKLRGLADLGFGGIWCS